MLHTATTDLSIRTKLALLEPNVGLKITYIHAEL